MPHPQQNVSAKRPRFIPIEIPAAADDGEKLSDLLTAGGLALGGAELVGVKILGQISDGTDRAAILCHHDGTSATMTDEGQHTAEGADWYEPVIEAGDVYVRALSGLAVPAIAVAYLD